MKAVNVVICSVMLTAVAAWSDEAGKNPVKEGTAAAKSDPSSGMVFGSSGSLRVASREEAEAASGASSSWLKIIDAGKFQEAWDLASPVFQKAVQKEQWCGQVGSVRNSTVKVVSRKLVGHPVFLAHEGREFIILHYDTAFDAVFENGWGAVVETVVLVKDAKTWKPDGYFVKPQPAAK